MKTLSRRHKLIELIRTLDDAQQNWDTRSGGGGPHLMPRQYHDGSYAELQHQLNQMRDNPNTRTLWWHLNQRYRWGTTRRINTTYHRTPRGTVPHLPPNTELIHTGTITHPHIQLLVYQWTPTVNPTHVDHALNHLLEHMPHHHLRLPIDILYRALGKPPPTERLDNHTRTAVP